MTTSPLKRRLTALALTPLVLADLPGCEGHMDHRARFTHVDKYAEQWSREGQARAIQYQMVFAQRQIEQGRFLPKQYDPRQ